MKGQVGNSPPLSDRHFQVISDDLQAKKSHTCSLKKRNWKVVDITRILSLSICGLLFMNLKKKLGAVLNGALKKDVKMFANLFNLQK